MRHLKAGRPANDVGDLHRIRLAVEGHDNIANKSIAMMVVQSRKWHTIDGHGVHI